MIIRFSVRKQYFLLLTISLLGNLSHAQDLAWARPFAHVNFSIAGGSNSYAIATDAAGNVYTAGSFYGWVDFNSSPIAQDILIESGGAGAGFIVKLDRNGNFVWVKQIGAGVTSFALDASGNTLLTGSFNGTFDFDPGAGTVNLTAVGGDTFLLKLDSNGDFVWVKKYGSTTMFTGASGNSLALDNSGNIYTVGHINGAVDLDPNPSVSYPLTSTGGENGYIQKLDSNGDFVWARKLGGPGSLRLSSISIHPSGGIYTTGYFYGTTDFDTGPGTQNLTAPPGGSDTFVLNMDVNGNFGWAKHISGSSDDLGYSLTVDNAGNVITVGMFYTGTTDFDPGTGTFNLSAVEQDIFVSKLDNNGNFVWAKKMGGAGVDFGLAVTADISGNIYTTGHFNGNADFDPGSATANIAALGYSDMFISKLDASGNFVWARRMGGSLMSVAGTAISVDGSANIHSTGYFGGFLGNPVDFDPGPGVVNYALVATGTQSFVHKIGQCVSPSAPSASTVSRCGNGSVTLLASGTTGTQEYRWYNVSVGGTLLSSTPSYTTPSLSSTATYYVSIVDTGTGCESIRTSVNAVVVAPPAAPVTVGNSGCPGTSVSLSASGGSAGQYRWYDVATGGQAIPGFTDGIFTTPLLTATNTYYVSIHNGTCEGARAQAVATVIPLPAAPTVQPVNPICAGSSVTLTATGGINGQYRWYDGGVLIPSEVNSTYLVASLTATKTFQVAIYDMCESNRVFVPVQVQSCNAPTIATTTATAFIEGLVVINLEELIDDEDNNIDPAALTLTHQPASGAFASLNGFNLTIDYSGFPFTGTDVVGIEACDLTGLCTEQQLSITLSGEIEVYNAISPNNDGKNDFFIIEYIEVLPETRNNRVTIYNRWGDAVFSIENYNNTTRVFRGESNSGRLLPGGTYFYKITFSNQKPVTGFLELRY